MIYEGWLCEARSMFFCFRDARMLSCFGLLCSTFLSDFSSRRRVACFAS